jgi:RNA polymerase sigma-70 factor (ECF subfamily)
MQIIHGISEKDLIVRLKGGDQTAFELLFHFYYPGLVIYSTQFLGDRAEAEEVAQDFFVRLWQKHQHLIPAESLKGYLFSSVRNGSLNVLKHKKIEEKYLKEMLDLSEHHLVYDPDLYVVSELQEKIKSSINELPEQCRKIFIMNRIQGMKNEDIALELEISKRTVETQISKSLKVLRIKLKGYISLLFLLGI